MAEAEGMEEYASLESMNIYQDLSAFVRGTPKGKRKLPPKPSITEKAEDGAPAPTKEVEEIVTLRIHIPALSIVTTMEFNASLLVYDVVLMIKSQVKELSKMETSKHFQLFIGAEEFKDGRWLSPKKTLKQLRLSSGVLVEFKSAVRDQRMKLMDGRVNRFPINEYFSVSVLIKSFCKCIGVKNASDYALCIDIEDDKLNSLDSKFTTFWLNDSQNLREQNISTEKVVAFRRRFYNDNRNVSKDDRKALNKVFGEISEAVISGRLPVAQSEATTCAAVIAQITLGDRGLIGKLDFKQFLPKDFQKNSVEKEVIDRYKRLQGLDEMMAKYRFFIEAKGLKHYGFKFFKVTEREAGKSNKEKTIFLGINPDVIVRVNSATKEMVSRWPLSKIHRFAASSSDISLDFGDWAHKLYNSYTQEATQIANLISSYYKNVQKCRYAFEDLKNLTELFTTPLDEEPLEAERSMIPKGPFGPSSGNADEKSKSKRKRKEGEEEVEDVVRTLAAQLSNLDEVRRVPSDEFNMPPDVEMTRQEVVSLADLLAVTVGDICCFFAAPESVRNYPALKQMSMTLAMQVPNLITQLKILAKKDQIEGMKESQFVPRAVAVAESAVPFLKAQEPGSKVNFIDLNRRAKSFIEALFGCKQEAENNTDSAVIVYKLTITQAAKSVNLAILHLLVCIKNLCKQCQCGPQQEDVIECASHVVEVAAQLYLLAPAMGVFENEEITAFILSLSDNICAAMNQAGGSCSEYLPPDALTDLIFAQEKVEKALNWHNELIEGGRNAANPIRVTAKLINEECSELITSPSSVVTQGRPLVGHLESLLETLTEEDDEDHPLFADAITELEEVTPKVTECSAELLQDLSNSHLEKLFVQQLIFIQMTMSHILHQI
eukprot:scpid29384/ scgid23452/ Talin-1